jgi:phosphonate transport system ATP-binding protein
VAIARAFILEPELLLADEPVASLDPQTSRVILRQLRDASRHHGATVLCSLHQVELAVEFADRIVAMRAGRIVFDGTPEQFDENAQRLVYEDAGPAEPHAEMKSEATPETPRETPADPSVSSS